MANQEIYFDAALSGTGGAGTTGDPYKRGDWSNMLTAKARDLTSTGEIDTIHIKGTDKLNSGNLLSGAQFSLAGWTQTATEYVHIRVWAGNEGDGTMAGTPGFTSTGDSFDWVFKWPRYTKVTGLAFINTSGSANMYGCEGERDCVFTDCIFQAQSRSTNNRRDCDFINCIAITPGGIAFHAEGGFGTSELSFCTAYDSSGGGTAFDNASNQTLILKNCVAYGSFTTEYDDGAGTLSSSSEYNAGEIAAASQPSAINDGTYVQVTSDPFETAGTDFTPTSGSDLEDAGVDIPAITTDIKGNTREDPPEIGAIEIVATGVTGSGTPASDAATTAGTAERELTSSGTPAAQAGTTAGTAERILECSGSLLSAASTTAGTALLQLKLLLNAANSRELRDENGAVVASLANIAFEWYDKDTDTEGNPDVSGTFSTNASGEATVQLPGTSLAAGQFGLLVLEHPTDNTIRGIYRIPVS